MKNFCSKFISIFAMSVFLSFAFVSCSDIDSNESATVSFSLSPDLAKAVLGAGRSAREATDDGTTGGDTVTPTENSDTDEDFGFYKIEVLLTGDQNEKQEQTYTSEEWKSIAKGSGVDSTFTFNDIRVGAEISVSATIYCGYENEHGHEFNLVYPCMAGSSDPVKIEAGENSVSCNVHRLARVNLYTYPKDGEIIPEGDARLDVYALPKDSEIANKILALVAEDDPKNNPEIYETLLSYPTVASYADSDSYLVFHTGGYELKDDAQVYMLSLLYTSDGAVYLGHPNVSSTSETLPEDAVTTIDINELNIIDLTLMKMDLPSPSSIPAFFPKKYADRTVAAWYACYGSDYTEAVFFFNEGEFVTTKHKFSSTSGETRTIQAAGEYALSGIPNDYDNNTGNAQFKDGDDEKVVTIIINNGVLTVGQVSSDAYARQSLDALPAAQDETSEDSSQHSPMEFEITLTNSNVPTSAELYKVTIFAINEDGYSNMSKFDSYSEQEKTSVLVETLTNESVGKWLGYYTPTSDNSSPISVSSDGVTITITDSYTAYGSLQANASTGIVAIVQYGDDSTYSNFFVGLSDKITTTTSSTNSVSMALAERNVPVQVNFYAGENPLLLSSCVIAVEGTWSVDTNSLSNNFSTYMSDSSVASHISTKGYSNPQLSDYTTTVTNGLPCFDVKVSVSTPTLYKTYTGSCTNGDSTYSLTLSLYAKSDSDGIYSVETSGSLLVSCGTYTIEKNVVYVLETNYRTTFASSSTLSGALDSNSQEVNTSASTFTLSSGSGITFSFSGQ